MREQPLNQPGLILDKDPLAELMERHLGSKVVVFGTANFLDKPCKCWLQQITDENGDVQYTITVEREWQKDKYFFSQKPGKRWKDYIVEENVQNINRLADTLDAEFEPLKALLETFKPESESLEIKDKRIDKIREMVGTKQKSILQVWYQGRLRTCEIDQHPISAMSDPENVVYKVAIKGSNERDLIKFEVWKNGFISERRIASEILTLVSQTLEPLPSIEGEKRESK